MLAVDGGEGLAVALLAPEELHHRHARDVLLQEGVDARHPAPNFAEGGARAAAEPVGHHEEQRDHGEGDQRELPVHGQHHAHDPEQREQVAEDGDHPGGEQLVDGVHVGGHARHQASHRVVVEEADVQPLQVRVDLAAQVHHHALPGHLQDVDLAEAHHEGGDEGGQVEKGHAVQATGVALPDVAVDGDLGEVGAHEVQAGHDHDEQERDQHRRPVGPEVDEKPPQQRAVVALGHGVVLVEAPRGHAVFSISSSRSWRRCRSA